MRNGKSFFRLIYNGARLNCSTGCAGGIKMELVLDRVTKQYKNKIAVDRLSAKLQEGVYGLLGANGAGKTTLMRMICGILEISSGEIRVDGMDIGAMGSDYRDILG